MRALLSLGVLVAACSGGGTKTPTTTPKKPLTAKEIVQQSSPAIVFVEVVGEGNARGSGTGFILDKSGLIATNFHVIAGSKAIKVKLYGGEVYQVTQIAGIDPGRDLAVLRIQPTKALATVRLGDSDAMTAGDQVVAIGNPLGVFDYSVSSGLLSQVRPICTADMVSFAKANGKRLEELALKAKTGRLTEAEGKEAERLLCRQELTFFQISAPISKGSSGGPLFNQAGEVIGVTTAIIADGQNINFAVPGNYLKAIITNPGAISMDDFAAKTRDNATDNTPVQRKGPTHPATLRRLHRIRSSSHNSIWSRRRRRRLQQGRDRGLLPHSEGTGPIRDRAAP
jgi:S1-C subfamily serine protease